LISAELKELLEGGLSLLCGTRDARLVPDFVRCVGARVEKGGREVTVFLPAATSSTSVANIADNGRVAVCVSRPIDHRTMQLKGRAVSCRPADESDRPVVDRQRAGFAATLAFLGVPPRLTLRMNHWPCHAVRVRVETIFDQTPGPQAGIRVDAVRPTPRKAAS
jgi:hypothetical protein